VRVFKRIWPLVVLAAFLGFVIGGSGMSLAKAILIGWAVIVPAILFSLVVLMDEDKE
jgi:hypothetical protein